MASPLYDKSKKDKPAEKPEEEAGGDGGGEKPAAAEGAGVGDATAESGDGGEPQQSPGEKYLDGLKALHQQHEAERRDFHNNHREGLRQMATRHGKALKDHFEMMFPEKEPASAPAKKAAEKPKEDKKEPETQEA